MRAYKKGEYICIVEDNYEHEKSTEVLLPGNDAERAMLNVMFAGERQERARTGIKDRAGQDIRVGDIITFRLNTRDGSIMRIGVVRCENMAAGCTVNFLPHEHEGHALDFELSDIVIIGATPETTVLRCPGQGSACKGCPHLGPHNHQYGWTVGCEICLPVTGRQAEPEGADE